MPGVSVCFFKADRRLSPTPSLTAGRKRKILRNMRPALLAEGERALPAAGKLAINLDKNLGIEQRAVLDAPRPIDAVALAKSIETVRLSGVLSPRKRQRVDDTLHGDRLAPQPRQLRVHEA